MEHDVPEPLLSSRATRASARQVKLPVGFQVNTGFGEIQVKSGRGRCWLLRVRSTLGRSASRTEAPQTAAYDADFDAHRNVRTQGQASAWTDQIAGHRRFVV